MPEAARVVVMVHTVVAALLMALCLMAAQRLLPTKYWSDVVGMPDLEAIVPKEFGEWALLPGTASAVVNPQLQASVDAIYDRVLARTYVHRPTGRLFMLSVAYGRDQSTRMQAHQPEMCYRSLGFIVPDPTPADLTTAFGVIPVMRLNAAAGARKEPITYWFRVGDRAARGSLERNLERMRFAARGYVAEGLLVRVSEITPLPAAESLKMQDAFVDALLGAMSPEARAQFIGVEALRRH
ncbi:MAG: EpsI family protein [Burkholderiales bacterium]|nr:EpsI family protein [Burkholderiales bacterium]